jgi:hypothetical protein
MVPQPGEQVAACGKGVVELAACWVTSQVTSFGVASLVCPAMNCCDSLVGTLAVAGVTVMRIPESILTVAVPVLLLSAFDVAVSVINSPDKLLGNFVGAVNVTVVSVEFAGIFPVAAVQGEVFEVVVVTVPLELVEEVLVVYEQLQTTVKSVAPDTVAVNVCVCVVTSVTDPGEMATVIVFALLLPHPFTSSTAHASATKTATPPQIFSHFIKTSSQADSGRAGSSSVVLILVRSCTNSGLGHRAR